MKELLDDGINVSFAQDSINDPWYSLGNGNLMNILDNGIHLAQTMSFEEIKTDIDLTTYSGAVILQIEEQYGLEENKPANFIIVNALTAFDVKLDLFKKA